LVLALATIAGRKWRHGWDMTIFGAVDIRYRDLLREQVVTVRLLVPGELLREIRACVPISEE
jgi:hypothetical protein